MKLTIPLLIVVLILVMGVAIGYKLESKGESIEFEVPEYGPLVNCSNLNETECSSYIYCDSFYDTNEVFKDCIRNDLKRL